MSETYIPGKSKHIFHQTGEGYQAPRGDEVFCQKLSSKLIDKINENDDDPRSALGAQAIRDLKTYGHWMPTYDARDASITAPEE
jgi:hypothetical protein